MKKFYMFSLLGAVLVLAFITSTCDNPERKTNVEIELISHSGTSATFKVTFNDLGSGSYGEFGVCYSPTKDNPTVSDTKYMKGTGPEAGESYDITINDLSGGTTYHVRAYYYKDSEVYYTKAISLTTEISKPTVTTDSVTNRTSSGAKCWGSIVSNGGAAITSCGVYYKKNSAPSTSDTSVSGVVPSGFPGSFSVTLTGLDSASIYYVCAYATNAQGTTLGSSVPFSTSSVLTVTLDSIPSSRITSIGARCYGNVLSEGPSPVMEKGFCWGTSSNPTINDDHQPAQGTGMGDFTYDITGLISNRKYYVRAYAKQANSNIGYSATQLEFTTLPACSVVTNAVTVVYFDSAVCGGNLVSTGGLTITERGICYKANSTPTIDDNPRPVTGTGTGSYPISINNLTASTNYRVRAYIKTTNPVDTIYGAVEQFTTKSTPGCSTLTVTNIDFFSATGRGSVIDSGGYNITERGICWGITNPTIDSNHHSSSGTPFTWNMTGLTHSTWYHVKAYIKIKGNPLYGNDVSFKTIDSVKDLDNNVYHFITIGTQIWMIENLKTTKYRTGEDIPNVIGTTWSGLTYGAYCDYDDNTGNVATYGRLYNWYAVNDSRNIAPVGWHVPTDNEWKTLEMYLGMTLQQADSAGWRGVNQGNNLKEVGNSHWQAPNAGTDLYGFKALPGGFRNHEGYFNNTMGLYGEWWSFTSSGTDNAWDRALINNSGKIGRGSTAKKYGFSIRLIKD